MDAAHPEGDRGARGRHGGRGDPRDPAPARAHRGHLGRPHRCRRARGASAPARREGPRPRRHHLRDPERDRAQDGGGRAGPRGHRLRPRLAPPARPLPAGRLPMKRWLVPLSLFLLLVPALPPARAQSLGPMFRRVNGSVVIIRAKWKEVGGSGQVGRVNEVGSGVLISPDGKVITASHVVQTADEITAEFLDGQVVGARVTASEPEADVSLLQLEKVPAQATVARMGNSDRAQVGDQVFIIGAPYGIGHTLSVGYITARHKPNTVYSEMALAEFFQTDAAINPGNSGGPMFSMAGEVVGIASHNISKSGGSEGLGFVVTINMARRLLLEQRSFWSGMSGVIIGGQVARALNLPQEVGLMVQQIAAESPAARIGLKAGTIPGTIEGKSFLLGGDIILAVQGREIGTETYEALQARLRGLPVGSVITVEVLRDGQRVSLEAAKD